jgi:hypothetical protein
LDQVLLKRKLRGALDDLFRRLARHAEGKGEAAAEAASL